MLNPICLVFPLVGTQSTIEDGTFCENVSQLEAINCSTSYLASIKLHLRCFIGFYSKCPLKDALPDIMKLLVIVNFNLLQGFWLYLKIPFLVKTKVKVGQMNW